MPRVIGIDPGTLTVDVCGLDDGRVFLERSVRTAGAFDDQGPIIRLLEEAGQLDLIAGPSGYGLPLTAARDISDADLRLAYLATEGESGGIGGLRSFMRRLAQGALPVVLTPGVIHLASVPAYRKVNRVDMGTADKVCAAALGIYDQMRRRACDPAEVSFILLELGGAFSASIAIDRGRIVDGAGGTSGPLGLRAAGALDGEVAFLAGTVPKAMLFGGGAASVAGDPDLSAEDLVTATDGRRGDAHRAYLESALKAIASMKIAVPQPAEVILSGRVAGSIRRELAEAVRSIEDEAPVHVLTGFAQMAKQGAQGAALIADGLAGGRFSTLVETMDIRSARGSALDHLYVISPSAARTRLGIA